MVKFIATARITEVKAIELEAKDEAEAMAMAIRQWRDNTWENGDLDFEGPRTFRVDYKNTEDRPSDLDQDT